MDKYYKNEEALHYMDGYVDAMHLAYEIAYENGDVKLADMLGEELANAIEDYIQVRETITDTETRGVYIT